MTSLFEMYQIFKLILIPSQVFFIKKNIRPFCEFLNLLFNRSIFLVLVI